MSMHRSESSSVIVQLNARHLGGVGNPPLVLLHGLLGSSRNWQSAGADLAGTYHVFALDLRNHGRSPHSDLMTYEAMMRDVLAWMDAHGLARVTLLGHSMGGKVAMLLACRNPKRVERLIVVDIAPKDYTSHAHRAEFAAMNALDLRALTSRAEAEARFETYVPDWGMRKFLTTNLERDEAAGGWKWLVNLSGLTTSLPMLEADSLATNDRFSGPTDFIVGEKSPYVRPEDREGIVRHFPYVRFATIAGSGHNPHMETRVAFVAAVLGKSL
jgi:pimeloyl-ACP methyl ester carboxylesterase